jgi:hypothetical protein
MNDTRVDIGDEEPNEEFLSQTSTIEALWIQAVLNQLTDIVENQNRRSRISYANQLIQVQTLQSLAQTGLLLTDTETMFVHGVKCQGFVNRAVLEHTLGVKIPNERPTSKPNTDDESTDSDEEPGTPSGQS